MKLGVIIGIDGDLATNFKDAIDMGFPTCQLIIWDNRLYTDENAARVRDAVSKTGMEISALWAGWSGPAVWDFRDGPETLGLVPKAFRGIRLLELYAASDFAEKINVTDVVTHVGYIPETPNHEDFAGVVSVLRALATYMKAKGQYFLFETGQETPVTLLRTIEEIATGNLGINFDSANLLAYGKGNPVDGAKMLGKYIRNTHIKDGRYPVNGNELGIETPPGEGDVNYPELLKTLKEIGYTGCLTIEREIHGEEQRKDILKAKDMLLEILRGD
jgi:sugar phosphate isomerase/epimerase